MKAIGTGIFLFLCLSANSFALGRAFISLGGGYNSPYGLGLEAQYFITKMVSANLGAGAFINGARIGCGSTVLFRSEKRLSPLLDGTLVYNTGYKGLPLRDGNGPEKEYDFPSGVGTYFGAGLRLRAFKIFFLKWTLGYNFPYNFEQLHIDGEKKSDNLSDWLVSPGPYLGASLQAALF